MLRTVLPDERSTLALGAALAPCLVPGLTIHLRGELGAGKTTLVRGVLRGLGYEGPVKSPTYSLVELYTVSRLDLHHFDLYRITNPVEWLDSGFRDYFDGHGVCLIEWPEKASGLLPPPDVEIVLDLQDAGRLASLRAGTPAGERCLAALADRYPPSSSAS